MPKRVHQNEGLVDILFPAILTGPCKGVRDATVHFYAEDVDFEREKG